jgi:hypothetical protein
MTSIRLGPQALAAQLNMDNYELAENLTAWAYTALPGSMWHAGETFGPMPLGEFDEAVAKARRYLVDANESMAVWLRENPTPDDSET